MDPCFTIDRYFGISNYIFSKKPKPTELATLIYKSVKEPIRWEMFYRISMKVVAFLQTTILLLFLEETQNIKEDLNLYMLFGLPIATLLLQMVYEYLRDWLIEINAYIWGGTNRMLRGLFFKKITSVEPSFLEAANESVVRKFDIY